MRRAIHVFHVNHESEDASGEKLMKSVVKLARQLAEEQAIKMPKRISISGNHSGWCCVTYTNNNVKDVLIQALKQSKVEFVLDRDYTFESFQTRLSELMKKN